MVSVLIILSLFTWFIVWSIKNPAEDITIQLFITGLEFALLGLNFGFVGHKSCVLIKNNFPEFYADNKRNLHIATIGLSVPLICRGALDITRYYNNTVRLLIDKYETIFNIFDFILLDFVPIMFQLSTLVFGLIRRRMDKKKQLMFGVAIAGSVSDNTRSQSTSLSNITYNDNYFDPPLF